MGVNIHTFSGYGTMVKGFLSSVETECAFLMRLLGVGGSSCSAAFRLGSKEHISTKRILVNHETHVQES